MRRILLRVIPCIAASLATPALASGQEAPISVTAPNLTVQQWSANVGTSLARSLKRAPMVWGHEGVAVVRFECNEYGKPTAIRLHQSSGDSQVDQAAKWAVRHARSLHPLPARMDKAPRVEAMILVANSQKYYDEHMYSLERTAADRRGRSLASIGQMAMNIRIVPVGEP